MWLRTSVSSALCCIMFPDLCCQIHRDRCDPLFWRKIQGDNSEVCVPPRHWEIIQSWVILYVFLSFKCLVCRPFQQQQQQQQQHVARLQSESRVFQMVKRWWVQQRKRKRCRSMWDQDIYSIINLFYLLVCSLRESVYQQRRESGRQHSGSPQNLQKHWDRDVSRTKKLKMSEE